MSEEVVSVAKGAEAQASPARPAWDAEVEVLLKHWGAQVQRAGMGGGLPSPLGLMQEYGGYAPRGGVAGAKLLLAGAGMDYAAGEVEAALAAVERWEGGELLVRLAGCRYAAAPALSKDGQIRYLALAVGDAGRKAYTRLVHKLHDRVRVALESRLVRQDELLKKSKRSGDRMRLLATRRDPESWVKEAGKRFRNDRSSGDSASVGATAPHRE
ncbi:hypothetical protein [Pseudomonas sp. ML96]|uniref:hypothetical protein n=1 Tax=Pseudomonas sp. ML96 TaxID=1523503 RepID=UPI0006892691|nr:hypothetical protein [Pseudomonas sp. ML96]